MTTRPMLFALVAVLVGLPAASQPAAEPAVEPAEPPLDSGEPLPARFQPQVNEILAFLGSQLLPSNPQEEKLKACWLETLRAADGDDRIIPWTRICPHQGADGLVCQTTSAGEARLGELIRSEADVPRASQSLERKFIVHLKTDLMVKSTHQLAVVNPLPIHTIYLTHLAALREDALLAMRSLGSAQGAAYAAIRSWIEARKKDPKSFYRCLALES